VHDARAVHHGGRAVLGDELICQAAPVRTDTEITRSPLHYRKHRIGGGDTISLEPRSPSGPPVWSFVMSSS
jgi:hypothetical protein